MKVPTVANIQQYNAVHVMIVHVQCNGWAESKATKAQSSKTCLKTSNETPGQFSIYFQDSVNEMTLHVSRQFFHDPKLW